MTHPPPQDRTMDLFEISDLMKMRRESGERYLEFFRSASLSSGIYELTAGSVDPQQPHTEDEVYYILKGRGAIQVGDESRPVQEGAVLFVEAGVVHRFHSITEDLTVLVVFAPPRGSLA